MKKLQVMFRGMGNLPSLESTVSRAVRDLVASHETPWTDCVVTFEAPPSFAAGDALWLHVDASAPGREVSVTRTQPHHAEDSVEEFVRRTFVGVLGSFRRYGTVENCSALAA